MKPVFVEATGMPTLLLLATPRRRVLPLRGGVGSVFIKRHSARRLWSSCHILSSGNVPAGKGRAGGAGSEYGGSEYCGGTGGVGEVGYWSTAVLEYWGTGVLRYGGTGVLRCWGTGVLGIGVHGGTGVLENGDWSIEVLGEVGVLVGCGSGACGSTGCGADGVSIG
jgi:hypothetical protein